MKNIDFIILLILMFVSIACMISFTIIETKEAEQINSEILTTEIATNKNDNTTEEKTTTITTTKKIINKDKYPEAYKIWHYLKKLGYNDYVCAGIMGNIMAECGGQTLNIQPYIYNSTFEYYGICQWSLKYCPSVKDMTLDEQLKFLSQTIEKEFNIFGTRYKENFKYKDFIGLKNEQDAALAFAKSYERCSSKYYLIRQKNAEIAYNYFVS